MNRLMQPTFLTLALCSTVLLAGCYNLSRVKETGSQPSMTPTQDPRAFSTYKPVRMPMPKPRQHRYAPNSLWRQGAKGFFKDQRANRVGDLVTVLVTMDDSAYMKNEITQVTDRQTKASLNSFFGLEKFLPTQMKGKPNNIVDAKSDPKARATIDQKRFERIKLKIAATVTQVLPNGNFVIMGRQEARVHFDVREVVVTGVVRPADITAENTIAYEQIAEARLLYGGRGDRTDLLKIPYGQQMMNNLFPF